MDARQLEVLGAGAGRDMDDPGSLVQRDLVPGNHAVLDAGDGRKLVEGTAVAEPHEL